MALEYNKDVRPPSSVWMGTEPIEQDLENRHVRLKFKPNADMCNFGGTVQGGFLSAMVDDAIGSLAFFVLGGKFAPASIDLQTHFMMAVPLDHTEVETRIIRTGKAVAFGDAHLYRADGELATCAASSTKLRPFTGLQFPTGDKPNG